MEQASGHKMIFCVILAFCLLLTAVPRVSSRDVGTDRSGAFQPAKAVQTAEDPSFSLLAQRKGSEKKGQSFGARVTETSQERKSVRKAVLLSLLLPGAGELYAGERGATRLFLSIEALIWSVRFGFKTYGDWRKDDYRLFSIVHAGANPGLNSEKYFDDLKFYSRGDRYNRLAFMENGPQAELYPEDALWEWDSEESQRRYRSLRNSSLLSYRYADYAIAGAVINRIVSAIHAARAARKTEARKQEVEEPGDFCLQLQSTGLEWRLSLTMNF